MADVNNRPPPLAHKCQCGKSYTTDAGLRQHQRRTCRRPASASDGAEGQCPVCAREFTSYAGMRQHLRLAHPVEYNADMEGEANQGRRHERYDWTEDELNEMAKEEVNYLGRNINIHLAAFMTRSIEAVRNGRKSMAYKSILLEAREAKRLEELESDEVFQIEILPTAPMPLIAEIDNSVEMPEPEVSITRRSPSPPMEPTPPTDIPSFLRSMNADTFDAYDINMVEAMNGSNLYFRGEIDIYLESIMKVFKKEGSIGQRRGKGPIRRRMGGDLARVQKYRRAQQLLTKNKSKIANEIIDGTNEDEQPIFPDINKVNDTYKSLFEAESTEDEHPINTFINHDLVLDAPSPRTRYY